MAFLPSPSSLRHRLLKVIGAAVLWTALFLLWFPQPALAHRPHDVVTQVKLSPTYGQDQTVYILVRGNLFKSTDGGESWQRLVYGLDNLKPFSAIAVDAAAGNVLMAATQGDGVYRSEDGGDSWRAVNNGLASLDISLTYVMPGRSSVAAAAAGGLYRTDTGEETWTLTLGPEHQVSALAGKDSRLWVGETSGQVMESDDGGQTWQPLASLPDNITALTPGRDGTLYAGTASQGVFALQLSTGAVTELNQNLVDRRIQDLKRLPGRAGQLMISTWDQGVGISAGSGHRWQTYDQGLTKDKMADDEGVTHFSEIAISDRFETDQTAFVGGFNGLYKSTDGGETWQELITLSPDTVVAMDVSPEYAEDGSLAIATYVGKIFTSQDRGNTWQLAMTGVDVPRLTRNFSTPYQDPRRFFDIAFSPNYGSDSTLWTTTLWTKFLHSDSSGDRWSIRALKQEARGLTLLPSPDFARDRTLFIGNQKSVIYRSQDGGSTFEAVAKLPWERGNDSPSMAISPDFGTDQTLYTVAETGVYRSTDAGQTWESTTADHPLAELGGLQVTISPGYGQDQTLYVGSSDGLFQTVDGGESWQRLDLVGRDRTIVEAVALSPSYAEDRTLLVSLRGRGLFKSTDGGQNFAPIGDRRLSFARLLNVPSAGRPIHFSPSYSQDATIFSFGSTTADIFRSEDGGRTWTTLTPPDRASSGEVGPLKAIVIAGDIYRKKLVGLGMLLVLAALGYGIASRFDVARLSHSQVRRLICAGGIAAAFGWVAFERLFAQEQSAENGFFICLGFAAVAWILTSPWFFQRFVGKTTAESLGAIRIISCATLVIMTLAMEDLPSSALLPVEIRSPMGIMAYFYAIPGFESLTRSQVGLQLFEWLTALLLLLGTVGFKTRWVLPLGGFSYLLLGGILRQYTWFYHTGLLPVYLLVVLALSPCSDGLSVDRWLKQRRGQPLPRADEPRAVYGWARYGCWVILAVSYVQAGLSKIYFSGFYWWAPENLKAKILSTTLEPLQTNWEVSLHLVNAPAIVFALLGIVGLYGELAYGLVLFFPWARLVMPAMMASVHIGIIFLQNIVFLDLILVQLIFYDYTSVRRWVIGKWKRNAPTPRPHRTGERGFQRLVFYPVLVSVLVVSMSFIWVKHREFYPFTSLQMFSGSNTTGVIGYNKLVAIYDSGEKAQVYPDELIYAPMNTRYRLTFRECHADDPAARSRCNKLLEALGTAHNRSQPERAIQALEMQLWEWNYRAQPNDEDYGRLIKTYDFSLASPEQAQTPVDLGEI